MEDLAYPFNTEWRRKMEKVAIVTGASKGIGSSIARKLGQKGCHVIVNYNCDEAGAKETLAKIIESGGSGEICQASIGKLDDVKNMVKYVKEKYGQIDFLVNNAGILRPGLLMMMKENEWIDSIQTNLTGTFYITKEVIKEMITRRRGKIVNISSVASLKGIVGQGVYAATKSGINAMTRVLAKEVAHYGINVNAIAPGYIDTDMVKPFENKRNEYMEAIPLQRYGDKKEVAELTAFLLEEGSDYITGQVICIDGGISI